MNIYVRWLVRTIVRRSPYTMNAGKTTIRGVPTDRHGNATGNQWDLAQDGGFLGHSIVVLHLYTKEDFDFAKPTAALKKKGFKVIRFENKPPPLNEFKSVLAQASQLWVISSKSVLLSTDHIEAIREFFDSGKGVYIWGDNTPFHADANQLLSELFNSSMAGNYIGNKVLKEASNGSKSGFFPHLVTTGLNNLFEGVTISKIKLSNGLTSIVNSSDGNCVTACYDQDGKRALIDGGFTRLYVQWDDAGSSRFVCNAAAWLVNWERFNQVNDENNFEQDRDTLRDLLSTIK